MSSVSSDITLAASLDDEPTKSIDFTPWELAKSRRTVSYSEPEFITLSENCFIKNPHYSLVPVYRAISPTHPQLLTFEQNAVMLTNELAQNALVISSTTACMYHPRGFPVKPPFPVLCLSINNERFLGRALDKTSFPIHLNIASDPIQLLTTTSSQARSGRSVFGPLFPGDALVGEGGRGTFGAYLRSTYGPQNENVVWGLTCGHVASNQEVTSYLRTGLYSPSIHDIQTLSNETFKEYRKRQTESLAEINVSNDMPLHSHSIQMINSILSEEIYNNFDVRQVQLEIRREEASHLASRVAYYNIQLNELEEHRRKCRELERVKANISLARVATSYRGEFGYVSKSLGPATLPVATSNPGIPSLSAQHVQGLESSCSEPTIAALRVMPMMSTDWLLVQVERAVEMGDPRGQWMPTPGDIVPGRRVSFLSGNFNNDNGLNPLRKGTINGMKAYISDHSIVTSEWVVFPPSFGSGFAEPGDSGGVIIDSDDGTPVGLIFAGNPNGSYIFVKPLKFVLDRIELLTEMKMNVVLL